jgi:hypothetical protein
MAAVAEAIVDRVAAQGIRCRPYEPLGEFNPPELLVPLPEVEQVTYTVDGVHRLTYDLIYVVGSAEDRADHLAISDAASKIHAAFYADKTLGGTVHGAFIRSTNPDDEIRDNTDGVWFGAFIRLEVHT